MGFGRDRHYLAELSTAFDGNEQPGDTLEQPEGANNSADVKLPGTVEDLRGLAKQCARFFLDHNAEPDTVDLLEELEIINDIWTCMSVYDSVCILYVIFHQTYYLSDVKTCCLHLMMSFSCALLMRSTSSITNSPRRYLSGRSRAHSVSFTDH
jgi:hypothetical protein